MGAYYRHSPALADDAARDGTEGAPASASPHGGPKRVLRSGCAYCRGLCRKVACPPLGARLLGTVLGVCTARGKPPPESPDARLLAMKGPAWRHSLRMEPAARDRHQGHVGRVYARRWDWWLDHFHRAELGGSAGRSRQNWIARSGAPVSTSGLGSGCVAGRDLPGASVGRGGRVPLRAACSFQCPRCAAALPPVRRL